MEIKLIDILKASDNIKGIVRKTPLEYSYHLSKLTDANIYLKLENQQKTGSFKLRGATNKIKSLTKEEMKKGVVTASAGNHAQGVAYVSNMLDIDAKIVVPTTAPKTKIESTKRLGANVIVHGKDYDGSEEYAYEIEKNEDRTFVHAFNDPKIIAGQGTIGLELLDDNKDLDIVLVPAGGGGLISGIARACKYIKPDIKIIAIQPEVSKPWYEAFKNKKYTKIEMFDSLADGLVGDIHADMVDDFNKYVDDVVLVSEDSIKKALYYLIDKHHQIAEGSSVVGIAALLDNKIDVKGKNIATIITGCNIDTIKVKEIINEYEGRI